MVASASGFDCAELGTHAGVDGFVDIICADDELVRAEFDALIADAWDDPPGEEQRLTDPPERRPGQPTILARTSLYAGGRVASQASAREARRARRLPCVRRQPGIRTDESP